MRSASGIAQAARARERWRGFVGVDFALWTGRQPDSPTPVHYRDARTDGMMDGCSSACRAEQSLSEPASSSWRSTPSSDGEPRARQQPVLGYAGAT
jgi:hypothetical protein